MISLELFGGEQGPAIVRVRRDGSIDNDFGHGGRAAIGSTLAEVADIAVQRDGDILAVGTRPSGGAPPTTQAVAVRLLPNGRPDRSFGENGIVVLPFEGRFQQAASVAAMPNGGILVDGGNGYVGRESVLAPSFVVRLRPDGRLDTRFADGGRLELPGSSFPGDLEPSGDGTVLMAERFPSEPGLRRLLPDGSFDPTFGQGGIVSVDRAGVSSNEPLFDPNPEVGQIDDGSILIGGSTFYIDSNSRLRFGTAVIRYSSGGVRDRSYGVRGTARAAFGGYAFAAALAVQGHGRAIVAGHAGASLAAVCFRPDGTRDARFGSAGELRLRVDGDTRAEDVVIQPGGRVVFVALSQNLKRKSGYNQTALAVVGIGRR